MRIALVNRAPPVPDSCDLDNRQKTASSASPSERMPLGTDGQGISSLAVTKWPAASLPGALRWNDGTGGRCQGHRRDNEHAQRDKRVW